MNCNVIPSLNMHTFGRLMIVIVCLLFNMNSYAAESEEEKDSPWLLTPTISSDPKLGTTLGFLGAYLKKFDEESPASMFGIMGSYSDTDSFFYGGFVRSYFDHDKQRITAAIINGKYR